MPGGSSSSSSSSPSEEWELNAVFVPAREFSGARDGFVFKKGAQGVGYYEDKALSSADSLGRKRPRQEDDSIISGSVKRSVTSSSSSGSSMPPPISRSQEVKVEPALSEPTVAKMCSLLEKKMQTNLEERSKFADNPARFMESEMELDEAISSLKQIASAPNLYSVMAKSGISRTLVALLAHENEELAKDVLSLFVELLESETMMEEPKDTRQLLDALLDQGLLNAIVSSLSRFDSKSETGALGVYHVMTIIENLVELRSKLADSLAIETPIIDYLLDVVQVLSDEDLCFSCAEILNVLLTTSIQAQAHFLELPRTKTIDKNTKSSDNETASLDNMERLLMAINKFRQYDPETLREQEFIANVFSALRGVLLPIRLRKTFAEHEGFILMLRIIKHRRFAYTYALHAICDALEDNSDSCEQLVQADGLKTLFPLFMGRSIGIKTGNHSGKGEKRKPLRKKSEIEEEVTRHVIHILFLLLSSLPPESISYRRIVRKFSEDDLEKTDRLLELHVEVAHRLAEIGEGDGEELLMARLDAGLETAQHIAGIIGHICSTGRLTLIERVKSRLHENRLSLPAIKKILDDYAEDLTVLPTDDNAEQVQASKRMQNHVRNLSRKVAAFCS